MMGEIELATKERLVDLYAAVTRKVGLAGLI